MGVAFGLIRRLPGYRHAGPDGQRISQPVSGHCGDSLIRKALGRWRWTARQGRLGVVRHVYRRGLGAPCVTRRRQPNRRQGNVAGGQGDHNQRDVTSTHVKIAEARGLDSRTAAPRAS